MCSVPRRKYRRATSAGPRVRLRSSSRATSTPPCPACCGSLPKNRDRDVPSLPKGGHQGPFALPGQTQHVAGAQRPARTAKRKVQHRHPRPAEDRGRAVPGAAGGQLRPSVHELRAGVNGHFHVVAPTLPFSQLYPGHAQVMAAAGRSPANDQATSTKVADSTVSDRRAPIRRSRLPGGTSCLLTGLNHGPTLVLCALRRNARTVNNSCQGLIPVPSGGRDLLNSGRRTVYCRRSSSMPRLSFS